jgi:hypothetical protein
LIKFFPFPTQHFFFTFSSPGIYTFTTSDSPTARTIIRVMNTHEICPDPTTPILPQNDANLISLGVRKRTDILTSPDWALIGTVGGLIFLLFFAGILAIHNFQTRGWGSGAPRIAKYKLEPAQNDHGLWNLQEPALNDAVVHEEKLGLHQVSELALNETKKGPLGAEPGAAPSSGLQWSAFDFRTLYETLTKQNQSMQRFFQKQTVEARDSFSRTMEEIDQLKRLLATKLHGRLAEAIAVPLNVDQTQPEQNSQEPEKQTETTEESKEPTQPPPAPTEKKTVVWSDVLDLLVASEIHLRRTLEPLETRREHALVAMMNDLVMAIAAVQQQHAHFSPTHAEKLSSQHVALNINEDAEREYASGIAGESSRALYPVKDAAHTVLQGIDFLIEALHREHRRRRAFAHYRDLIGDDLMDEFASVDSLEEMPELSVVETLQEFANLTHMGMDALRNHEKSFLSAQETFDETGNTIALENARTRFFSSVADALAWIKQDAQQMLNRLAPGGLAATLEFSATREAQKGLLQTIAANRDQAEITYIHLEHLLETMRTQALENRRWKKLHEDREPLKFTPELGRLLEQLVISEGGDLNPASAIILSNLTAGGVQGALSMDEKANLSQMAQELGVDESVVEDVATLRSSQDQDVHARLKHLYERIDHQTDLTEEQKQAKYNEIDKKAAALAEVLNLEAQAQLAMAAATKRDQQARKAVWESLAEYQQQEEQLLELQMEAEQAKLLDKNPTAKSEDEPEISNLVEEREILLAQEPDDSKREAIMQEYEQRIDRTTEEIRSLAAAPDPEAMRDLINRRRKALAEKHARMREQLREKHEVEKQQLDAGRGEEAIVGEDAARHEAVARLDETLPEEEVLEIERQDRVKKIEQLIFEEYETAHTQLETELASGEQAIEAELDEQREAVLVSLFLMIIFFIFLAQSQATSRPRTQTARQRRH